MKNRALFSTAAAVGVAALVPAAGVVAALWVKRRKANNFFGKVVVITGSSRGLGLAIAEQFARKGSLLCLTARSESELSGALTRLSKSSLREPSDILVVPADLRDPTQCDRLVKQVIERFGKIDILVNNAGVIAVGPIESQSIETVRGVMDANFFAGTQCSLAALPEMIKRRSGVIVNIASIGGKMPVPHLLPYTASKYALVGFSEGLHAEVRAKGVHVLTVCPGLMRTGSHIRALFTGDAPREYRWFSLLANLPGLSVSAHRAAKKIMSAVASRKAEITITPAAAIAAPLASTFPSITGRVSSLINRFFLPSPLSEATGLKEGRKVRSRETGIATWLGAEAASRYNQES